MTTQPNPNDPTDPPWRPLVAGEWPISGDKIGVLLGGLREPQPWDWQENHVEGTHQSHWRTRRPRPDAATVKECLTVQDSALDTPTTSESQNLEIETLEIPQAFYEAIREAERGELEPLFPLPSTTEEGAGQGGGDILAKHQPCGCVLCTCEDEVQCQGCGAKNCGKHPTGQFESPVFNEPKPTQNAREWTISRLHPWVNNGELSRKLSKEDAIELADRCDRAEARVRELEAAAAILLNDIDHCGQWVAPTPAIERLKNLISK